MIGFRKKKTSALQEASKEIEEFEKRSEERVARISKRLSDQEEKIAELTEELMLTEQAIGILGISKEQLENAKKLLKNRDFYNPYFFFAIKTLSLMKERIFIMTNFERFLEMSTESEAIRDALRTFDAYRNATTLKMLKYDIFFKNISELKSKRNEGILFNYK